MKIKFLIITSYSKKTGYGNFIRSGRFFNYLKKRYSCQFLVKTDHKNLKFLKDIHKKFEVLNINKINLRKDTIIFLDMPNLSKKEYKILKKGKLICYGNNNYFDHAQNIIPFNQKMKKNSNIKLSITNNDFKQVRYFSLKKLYFFIYLSTSFDQKTLKKIIFIIRKEFSNKILLFTQNMNIKHFCKTNKVKIINKINHNYLKDNMIYIGNTGSGSIDRTIKGVLSFTFSKNKNEKKIFNSLKKLDKKLFYFGEMNNFNIKKFNISLKKLKKLKFPIQINSKIPFTNNNLNLERKIISLYSKTLN